MPFSEQAAERQIASAQERLLAVWEHALRRDIRQSGSRRSRWDMDTTDITTPSTQELDRMRRMWLEAWTAPSEPDEDTAPPKGHAPPLLSDTVAAPAAERAISPGPPARRVQQLLWLFLTQAARCCAISQICAVHRPAMPRLEGFTVKTESVSLKMQDRLVQECMLYQHR